MNGPLRDKQAEIDADRAAKIAAIEEAANQRAIQPDQKTRRDQARPRRHLVEASRRFEELKKQARMWRPERSRSLSTEKVC